MGNGHRRPALHFNHSNLKYSITASLKQSPGHVSLSHLTYEDRGPSQPWFDHTPQTLSAGRQCPGEEKAGPQEERLDPGGLPH